ncbi:Nucleotide-binding universal stress protein, UspA family [Loktanella fryxellensis]|uniref:Nucleotide-binding universal stress protein, UspA family n=1 Tax=Loktanella fryxellensis TaxID=245187 RepID=A0A1H8HK43_9RHOB|nr:universal stress protein [Loktanella fryxellensis]SEN55888.1 Nucleotide-binding universal stress protein, UspA family [Loktanella fryxellensis]
MFSRILVCTDGSDHAAAALRIAAGLAHLCQGDLQIVHVAQVHGDAVAGGADVIYMPMDPAEVTARAEAVLADASRIATDAGATAVTTHILRGLAADAILEHAATMQADLIVAGRRGFGAIRGLLLGSVSQSLNVHATCPVLTVQ